MINYKHILSILLTLFITQETLAFGREHEYKITVVNSKKEPIGNLLVKTQKVRGYDQKSGTCITSQDGTCTLKFSAFAVSNPEVIVTLLENEQSLEVNEYPLPKVENSWLSNKDGVEVVLVYERLNQAVSSLESQKRLERWDLQAAPRLSELISTRLINIQDLINYSRKPLPETVNRDKFETDQEYADRVKQSRSTLFFIDLPVNDDRKCKTDFRHQENLYRVNCRFSPSSNQISFFQSIAEPIVLSNAYDRRTINRILQNRVFLAISFEWSAEFKVDRNFARQLESDLAIGFFSTSGVKVQASCSLCESRDRQDAQQRVLENLNTMNESLSALRNRAPTYTAPAKNWKDDAFRQGQILEDWSYSIDDKAITDILIFRKSDQRVLARLYR